MKLSRYFANLSSSYQAELLDLSTDSEGKNVLKARLAKKRGQVSQLLMMLQSAPEMVAVAFHGGFFFKNAMAMEKLVTNEPQQFPSWEALKKNLILEPWAQTLADTVLTDPAGDAFLVTVAGLEYLYRSHQTRTLEVPDQHEDDSTDDHDDFDDSDESWLNSDERAGDDGEATELDLDRAGADWLAEQGFDRKE